MSYLPSGTSVLASNNDAASSAAQVRKRGCRGRVSSDQTAVATRGPVPGASLSSQSGSN